MKFNKWQCYLQEVWYSIKYGFSGFQISGHSFVDEEEHKNCTVQISRCSVCGELDISWYNTPPLTIE